MKHSKKLKRYLIPMASAIAVMAIKTQCLATEGGTIGTAQVKEATENIKRVITSIAMPLRWCTYICEYSCSSIKNDSKFK